MAKADEAWRAEIEALRAEIEALKSQKQGERSAAAEKASTAAEEMQSRVEAVQKNFSDLIDQATEVVGDLQRRFNEGTQTAEETVAQHPVATLAAAFLLGLVIGRLTR